jgi:hypothetical protein
VPQGEVRGQRLTQPRIVAPRTQKVRSVLRRGLRLRVSCVEACAARSVLRISGQRIGASKRLRIGAGGTRTVVIKLSRNVRRNLLAAMRQARMRGVTATAITTVRTAELSRAYPAKVRLKR